MSRFQQAPTARANKRLEDNYCQKNPNVSFILIPQMFIFHNVTITYPANFTQCTTRGSFVAHWQETAYNMFTFSCLFLLPLVIMIVCYTRIFIQISKRITKKNCKCTDESCFKPTIKSMYRHLCLPQ